MPLTLKDPSLFIGKSLINGEWIDADNGGTVAVDNPATGEIIGEIARCGTALVNHQLPLLLGPPKQRKNVRN